MSVIFDQLKISDGGDRLYIDIHVNNASVYSDFYLDTLTVVTADKVKEMTSLASPTKDFIYKYTFSGNQKGSTITLDKSSFDAAVVNTNSSGQAIDSSIAIADTAYTKASFAGEMFFVYVKCKRTGSTDLPCNVGGLYNVGVIFDTELLYQKAMAHTKELADTCGVSKGFTDFILLWNAFKAAVETGHYISAIKFYNQLFSNTVVSNTNPCSCHG